MIFSQTKDNKGHPTLNSTKSELEKPVLLTEMMSLIEKYQTAYGQKRVFNRSLALVMAELFAFGRHTLNDGRYDTLEFWPGLPCRTVGVVRTARNRCLYELPPAQAHGNRLYGPKAPAPHEWLKQRKGFSYQEVPVRGQCRRIRYRVEGPLCARGCPIFLCFCW